MSEEQQGHRPESERQHYGFSFLEPKREMSRLRGARRGNASRYALRSLPPVEEDEP